MLDVRYGTEQEARAVLEWIERDRDEFEQVVTLAGLEIGRAERFERVVREVFEGRFQGELERPDRVTESTESAV